MGILQPAGPLWDAVRGIYDPWPTDDEAIAADVALAWRGGGTVLADGAQETARAGDASLTAWPDPVGVRYGDGVRALAAQAGPLQQRMEGRAAHAEYYGAELTSAKQVIADTIARNEAEYARLGDSLGGPALQAGFASSIAASLQGMIAAKADALRQYPVPDPDPEPPDHSNYPASPDPKPDDSRRLTAAEVRIAREVFGDSLNLDNVRLLDGGIAADFSGGAVTIHDAVVFPEAVLSGNTTNKDFQAWLVHELTHVWQYQNGKSIADLIPAAATKDYEYGGTPALRDALATGKTFDQFSTEQQADIVAEYWYGKETGEYWRNRPGQFELAPYEEFIKQVRDRP